MVNSYEQRLELVQGVSFMAHCWNMQRPSCILWVLLDLKGLQIYAHKDLEWFYWPKALQMSPAFLFFAEIKLLWEHGSWTMPGWPTETVLTTFCVKNNEFSPPQMRWWKQSRVNVAGIHKNLVSQCLSVKQWLSRIGSWNGQVATLCAKEGLLQAKVPGQWSPYGLHKWFVDYLLVCGYLKRAPGSLQILPSRFKSKRRSLQRWSLHH